MSLKAIFIAPSFQQALWWAEHVWGFERSEWVFLPTGRHDSIQGIRNPGFPAFFCGDVRPSEAMERELEIRGIRLYNAEIVDPARWKEENAER